MILLNFSHPLTEAQVGQIEALAGRPITRLVESMPQFDNNREMGPQIVELADGVGLTSREWQTPPLLVNLPGLAAGAACLLAEIHGRHGGFPVVVRLAPFMVGALSEYRVAELMNLHSMREAARERR